MWGDSGLREKEAEVKKIKFADFGSLMKSVFFTKFSKKLGDRKVSSPEFEDFKTYLGHYKAGQEETANFLSYYDSIEVNFLTTFDGIL